MLFDCVYVPGDNHQVACCSLCEVFQEMIIRVFNGDIRYQLSKG